MATNKQPIPIHGIAVVLLLICHGMIAQKATEPGIRGKLTLDTLWEPVVYLSHIPTFKDMHTMSNAMIIAETPVDSTGHFHFPASYLFENDHLFRLHISKKEAPAASLIIGGDEENHIFFIANASSNLFIENHQASPLFTEYTISGYEPNEGLFRIDQIMDSIESLEFDTAKVRSDFLTKSVHEKLRMVADTSSHPIVSMYALHRSEFETTFLTHREFYQDYLKKWEGNDSTYFTSLRNQFPEQASDRSLWYVLIGVGFFVLGYFLRRGFAGKSTKEEQQLRQLSVQERKIFQQIQSGKSNKEISDEFNIGLSTVKSHVSNIYSKLNIKSRREAMDIKG